LGEYGVGMMTELRGASNHKAKTLLRGNSGGRHGEKALRR